MKVYRVKNWNDVFENNKSRERETCSFVCVPNKQHGMGFSRVMAEQDGATIYGIWHMIVGACSQQKKPRNGWLTHDGHQTGTAWAPDDLALKFRRPEAEVIRALEVLSSEKVGWIEVFEVDENQEVTPAKQPGARQVPAQCPPSALERREEKEEKEGEEGSAPAPEIAEGAVEIPDEKTAIELAGMRAIPADFAKLCFGDWMDNNGCNSKNIPKPWQSYVSTRWRYEQEEWRSGKHRGKQSSQAAKVGPKQSEVIAYAKEKGDTYGTYAVSWFSYWNDPKRSWKKNGITIDWKNEFQNSYASHRQKEAA